MTYVCKMNTHAGCGVFLVSVYEADRWFHRPPIGKETLIRLVDN